MLQGEHSAILSTFIKLPFAIKTFVLSIFEWPFKTGFTGCEYVCVIESNNDRELMSLRLYVSRCVCMMHGIKIQNCCFLSHCLHFILKIEYSCTIR